MASITAGQTGTFTLDAFGYIDVVAAGDGTLNATSRAPNLKSNVSISKLASVRYGPYGVPMDFTIACTNGTITYTTTAGYAGAAASVAADDVTIIDAGGYFTGAEVETALQELGADVAGINAQTFYFSAAGTYIVALGPVTAYSLFLTTSVVGSVRIYDNTAASGPDVLGSTATAVASNVSIPIGTAPTYGAAATGLCLVVVGNNVGYLTFGG